MRICSGPGCLRAVPDDVRFCDECKRPASGVDGIREHTSGYNAELDAAKKSVRWQRLRALIVREQPICQRCRKRITQIVDHIVPAEIAVMQAKLSGKYLDPLAGYFIRSNLQGLCRVCHRAKTDEDKAQVGEWPDVLVIDDRRPKKVWSF